MVNHTELRECQVAVDEHVGHIKLPKTLTVLEAVAFKQSFQDLCQTNPNLTAAKLDFANTQFIDSSGIGAMMGVWKIAKQHNVAFSLHNVPQQVMMSLSLAGLDQYLEIHSTLPTPPTNGQNPRKQKVSIQQSPSTHPSVRSPFKRLVDIVGGSIGLGITAILFIPIAIAIKIEDGGPIFFSQTRCSWMGRRFTIWKFRSMVTNAEALKEKLAEANEAEGAIFKIKDDPRITRVGKLLRKTSLDEFPQFWNVVKGDMSLVGTRPPTPDEIELYEVAQWQRLDVKPGLTGEWQVHGRSSVKDFEDIIKLDLRYQERWSIMYDFQLIFKTVAVLLSKESGAY
jgi:anti-anti-sigma factor